MSDDTLTGYYAEVMNEIFADGLSRDRAVALTYILDNYRLHFSKECVSEYGAEGATPVNWTLNDATAIVCQIEIDAQVEVGDATEWGSLCNTRFMVIYDQPQFAMHVQNLIDTLLTHRCVNKVEKNPDTG